jgi:hypothetical protein
VIFGCVANAWIMVSYINSSHSKMHVKKIQESAAPSSNSNLKVRNKAATLTRTLGKT